jgi:hypothetical protein
MSEKKTIPEKENKSTNWVPTLISIMIGIIVTVGATWYTVESSRKEVEQAESERLSKVKENLVSIIEEHIVNRDSIDLKGFNRLINNRTREENLYTRPTIYNLLTQAEYNIQSSKHLSFDKKLEYAKIISTLYDDFETDTISSLINNRFPDETLKVISFFNETDKIEGKTQLAILAENYEQEIKSLQKSELKKESIIDNILQSPSKLIIVISLYLLITIILWYYMKMRRRRMKHFEILKDKTYFERDKIKTEIEHLIDLMNKEKSPKAERKNIEERIDFLFEKLNSLDKNYSQQHV